MELSRFAGPDEHRSHSDTTASKGKAVACLCSSGRRPRTGETRRLPGDGTYGRLRAVVEGPDGALYVTTSNRDGRGDPARADDRILRIVPPAG